MTAAAQLQSKEEAVEFLSGNYEAWAGTLFMIRDKRNDLRPLELNAVQRKIGEIEKEELALHGNARIYVLKARQGGVSTDQQARSLHTIWSTPGAVALTLAHAREDTDKIFQITRRAIQNFPKDYLPSMGRSEAKEITFPRLDSAFWTGTAGSARVGRGITITRFHGSEFAFWVNPRAVLGSISPAMIPQGSSMILETTPDAFESEAHQFWKESKEGETGYRCVFFPWWECDVVNYRIPLLSDDEFGPESLPPLLIAEGKFVEKDGRYYTKEEGALVIKYGLDAEQIKWRRAKIKELKKSTFLREYPEDDETCWMIAGEKFYDADILQELLPLFTVPKKKENRARIQIFDEQDLEVTLPNGALAKIREHVIIGCDVSEGIGGDRSAWVARAFPSWRLLAQFADRRCEPDELADLLHEWGINQYGEALLVVEKNSHGITVLRRLRDHHKYPRRSLYHRTPLGQIVDKKTDFIGWTTTGESLPLMLDYGREILNSAHEGNILVPSREMLLDLASVPAEKPSGGSRLTGRDVLVSEILAWAGKDYHIRRRIQVMKPLHW